MVTSVVEVRAGTERHTDSVTVLRVTVAAAVVFAVWYSRTWRYGELDGLEDAPRFAWWLEWLPWPGVAGSLALVAACVGLAVGWRTRTSALAVTLLGLWVLGVPQMFGKVAHYHHLIWLPLLFVVPKPSVRAAQVMLASCYLFPGLAKLMVVEWWTTDHLMWMTRNIAYWKDWTPPVDLPPWMWTGMAVGTVVVEVAFLPLTLTRWHRHVAVGGLGMHLSVWWLTGLVFWPLLVVYPILFLRSDGFEPRQPAGRLAVVWLVAVAFMSAPMSRISSWPIDAYPRFDWIAQPDLIDTVYLRDGEQVHPGTELAPWAPLDTRTGLLRLNIEPEGVCEATVKVDLRTSPPGVETIEPC